MCLIFTHHKNTVLDEGWIGNFYWHNPDGIGVMSAIVNDDGVPTIQIEKYLPKDEKEAWEFYQGHIQGKECVVHFRMATHGHTDLSQTHPYIISADRDDTVQLAFCHNGILSCGNASDRTKSDTWHFNEWYLKPLLDVEQDGYPRLAMKPEFATIIGDYIGGSNRFVFMNDRGEVNIVNEDTGVYWRGMWLANTYAWDAPSHVFAKAHRRGKLEEVHDDFADVAPDAWESTKNSRWYMNYREDDYQYASSSFPTGTRTAGVKSLVPSTGTTTPVVVASNDNGKEVSRVNGPFMRGTVAEWNMNQYDSMFNMLKGEKLDRAWARLTYKDLDNFEQHADMDQLWDVIYCAVDDVISEDRLVKIITNPKEWASCKERDHWLTQRETTRDKEEDVAAAWEEYLARQRAEDNEAEGVFDTPTEDEVIEATLPRKSVESTEAMGVESALPRLMPDFTPDGRPLYDCRNEV